MNKLQVTAEQAKALDLFVSKGTSLETFTAFHKGYRNNYSPLNAFSIDQMAVAKFIGYEIEKPKIKAGEWVTRIREASNESSNFRAGVTFQVNRTTDITAVDQNEKYHAIRSLRHATPVEIFWAELNRPDQMPVVGDVVLTTDGEVFRVRDLRHLNSSECTIQDALRWIERGSVKNIYPVDSRKEVPKNAKS